ncbi:hypothetical protein AQUCO_09500023v1 [Aquilegia coerulea]|uniref:Protein kinase domain-containing protein n=1 Tax=Aquilegia coerulea TaxID=218851 RepID=A0A2G5C622_AQUCA|nr:hypothetical protein AQUCO_09500023v1 [Aquilegia coerulea]
MPTSTGRKDDVFLIETIVQALTKKPKSSSSQKGLLIQDERSVLIKKFGEDDELYIQQTINEITIASQVNKHAKVLCLLGCCLETKAPILVFEYAPNGALSDHIHRIPKSHPPMSWDRRLKIVLDIAEAVTYLHLGSSKPIIHRHISSSNIFLDEHFGAKLSDFCLSASIPFGETHVDAQVVGIFGFLAPECLSTGRYTEKFDVFSIGAVLFEILTGNRAYDILQAITSQFIAQTFLSSEMVTELYLNANIFQVLEKPEQVKACSNLALRCVKEEPEERPTMKEIDNKLFKSDSNMPMNGDGCLPYMIKAGLVKQRHGTTVQSTTHMFATLS